MNLKVGRDSVEPWNLFGAMSSRARRSLALPRRIGTWSQLASKIGRFSLSMNLSVELGRDAFHRTAVQLIVIEHQQLLVSAITIAQSRRLIFLQKQRIYWDLFKNIHTDDL